MDSKRKPQETSTAHLLPFEKLSPADFERLCLALVQREGYPDAEHFGEAGADGGRDIVARRAAELVVFQCKRVKNFGPRDAELEINKILALQSQPTTLVLIVTCAVSAATRERAEALCNDVLTCRFWGITELDARTRRHWLLVWRFFSSAPRILIRTALASVAVAVILGGVSIWRSHRLQSDFDAQRALVVTLTVAYMQQQADDARLQTSPQDLISRSIQTLAELDGLSPEKTIECIGKFIATVRTNSATDLDKALAAFAEQQFAVATDLACQAGDAARVRRLSAEAAVATASVAEREARVLQGRALAANRLFGEAVVAFRLAEAVVTFEDSPVAVGLVQLDLGRAFAGWANVSEGPSVAERRGAAIGAYRKAVALFERLASTEHLVTALNGLGATLSEHGLCATGADATRALEEGIDVIERAMALHGMGRTATSAALHNNHGAALRAYGDRVEPPGQEAVFEKALASFRRTLELCVRSRRPRPWVVRDNIGIVLQDLAYAKKEVETFLPLIQEAIETLRTSLQEGLQYGQPSEIAWIQNDLGVALNRLGSVTAGAEGERLLAEAGSLFQASLRVRTREALPQEWAATRVNLGAVLKDQGVRATGDASVERLSAAATEFRSALQVFAQDALPYDWVRTQRQLATVLMYQGARAPALAGATPLEESVVEFRRLFAQEAPDLSDKELASARIEYGYALYEWGKRIKGERTAALLRESIDAFEEALQVLDPEHNRVKWGRAQGGLGEAATQRAVLSAAPSALELLTQAVDAFRSGLSVHSAEKTPEEWVRMQINLGMALVYQAARVEEGVSNELLTQAANAFRSARQGTQGLELLEVYWRTASDNLIMVLLELLERSDDTKRGALQEELESVRSALTARRAK
ncbi:MAG: restriction endonuclease [Planctomycetes bacterium]|nr:restriction endonuclease [Planctomycetota bacterium]